MGEAKYNWTLPPDLKSFLQIGIPPTWYNFHDYAKDDFVVGCDADMISKQILWNATPPEPEYARIANEHPLIPLYMHRMMPTVPCQEGLPIVSMHQCSDNIVYGKNLWEYLERDGHIASGLIPDAWM